MTYKDEDKLKEGDQQDVECEDGELFDIIVSEKHQQIKDKLKEEEQEEWETIKYLDITYKDACRSEAGKESSRSFSGMLNRWLDTLGDEQVKRYAWLIRSDEALELFKDWIYKKYEGNKKAMNKWVGRFENKEVVDDMNTVLKNKILEMKIDPEYTGLCEFQSDKVEGICKYVIAMKEGRGRIHEAINRAKKILINDEDVKAIYGKSKELDLEEEEQLLLLSMIRDVVEEELQSHTKLLNSVAEKIGVPMLEDNNE